MLQGDYSCPARLEIIYALDADEVEKSIDDEQATVGEQYLPAEGGGFAPGPHYVEHITPLDGIRTALPGHATDHAKGCDVTGDDASGIEEATRIAFAAGARGGWR